MSIVLTSILTLTVILSSKQWAVAMPSFTWTSPWVVSVTPDCSNLTPFPNECLGSRIWRTGRHWGHTPDIRGTGEDQAVA